MMKRIFCIVFSVLLFMQPLSAQLISAHDSRTRIISLGYTSDAFATMELGYTQSLDLLQEKDLRVYTCFSFPFLLTLKNKTFDSWEFNLGANAELFSAGKFGTISDIRVFLRHHNQILGTFIPLGINLRLTPSYYFPNGYMGLQINWNQTIATHISHSTYVKNTFTDLNTSNSNLMKIHPKDGWHGNTGSHFGFGIECGWELGSRFFLYGDLGIIKFMSPYYRLFDAMSMGQIPLYLNLRLFYKI